MVNFSKNTVDGWWNVQPKYVFLLKFTIVFSKANNI